MQNCSARYVPDLTTAVMDAVSSYTASVRKPRTWARHSRKGGYPQETMRDPQPGTDMEGADIQAHFDATIIERRSQRTRTRCHA